VVDAAPGPSEDRARAFVAARWGADAADSLMPAGAGEWSRAFAFRLAMPGEPVRETVIRFGRYRTDFVKDRIVGNLVRGPGAPPGIPVPRVWEIGDTPWGHFVIAERAAGGYLDELDGAGMAAALPALLGAMDAVADLTPAGPGYGLWDADGVAPHRTWRAALLAVADEHPRTAGWRELLASRPGPARVFRRGMHALDEALERIQRDWGDPVPRRIVHADLLNRNVLVDTGGAVTAVLDWGNALYGDFAYDLAWLQFWWPWYPAWSTIDIRGGIEQQLDRAGRRPADLDARLVAYRWHIGLDSLTYQAFTRRWNLLDRVADQLDDLLRHPRAAG